MHASLPVNDQTNRVVIGIRRNYFLNDRPRNFLPELTRARLTFPDFLEIPAHRQNSFLILGIQAGSLPLQFSDAYFDFLDLFEFCVPSSLQFGGHPSMTSIHFVVLLKRASRLIVKLL